MKNSKFTGVQIAFALKQAETGTPVEELCRKLGITSATFYNLRKKYGGPGITDLRRLKQLEQENSKLKKIVADMSLDKHNYAYKYDLIRNYLLELIHFSQKLQPTTSLYYDHNASARVASLFIYLLERQFPIVSYRQRLNLPTAKDFADRLSVHVNHLNKFLKDNTNKTITETIATPTRIFLEAKLLLKQTNWNISEIAYSLGFEEVPIL